MWISIPAYRQLANPNLIVINEQEIVREVSNSNSNTRKFNSRRFQSLNLASISPVLRNNLRIPLEESN
jgi:hypothetical protein